MIKKPMTYYIMNNLIYLLLLSFIIMFYSPHLSIYENVNNFMYEKNEQYILLFLKNPFIRASIFLLLLLNIDEYPFVTLMGAVGVVASLHLTYYIKTFKEYLYLQSL